MSRKVSSVAIMLDRAAASASMSDHSAMMRVGALTGLDEVCALHPGPVGSDAPVGVDEVLIAAGLDPEPHGVEGGHVLPPME